MSRSRSMCALVVKTRVWAMFGLDVGSLAPAVEFKHVGAFEGLRCDGFDVLGRQDAGHEVGDPPDHIGECARRLRFS